MYLMCLDSPASVYLPALYICGDICDMRKQYAWWYEIISLHAFLSCDHWFVNHFVICSINVLYKYFSVP